MRLTIYRKCVKEVDQVHLIRLTKIGTQIRLRSEDSELTANDNFSAKFT